MIRFRTEYSFFNKTKKKIDYETSITVIDSGCMKDNPFGEIMMNNPTCISISFHETEERPVDFEIKTNIRIVTDDGFAYYSLTGAIIKTQKDEYCAISEDANGNWLKYEHGFIACKKEDIEKYNTDIGHGQVIMAFYKNVPESNDTKNPEIFEIPNAQKSQCEEQIDIVKISKKPKIDTKTKPKKKNKETPVLGYLDPLHFKRMFDPYWEYERNNYKGIRNAGHTCHLNVSIQFLFSIEDIVREVKHAASKGLLPAKYFDEVFDILKEDNPEVSASAQKIIEYFHIDSARDYDAIETLEMVIKELHTNLMQNKYDLIDLFSHDYYSEGNKCLTAFRIYPDTIDLEKALIKFMSKSIYQSPRILYIHISDPSKRPPISVPLFFTASKLTEKPTYHLYAIIAYASMHYVIFINKCHQWIVFNDEYCYNVSEEALKDLYDDVEKHPSEILQKTQQNWRAYVYFYIKQND